ncbi:hypothetical protein FisN_17Lh217 [Fistulifera solaris]|uniref:CW-type domain-containing protein n=1 Tax=Fistulifera solaris TaxID=1519565 RepID=A0A1Z5KI68_FISSO|nr:hypothetical protein FisN_17Lh217 [Fistulifera solaris]|eukprot:GAX25825.1 hypothetical protein FisN_17Lh217 [Fistulifera solaris]
MSSLRLALKKSIEEAKGGGKGISSKNYATDLGDDYGESRDGGETPRKRGRPRKNPPPRDGGNEENFSSENEFSVGHAEEDDDGSETSDRRRSSNHEAANRIQKQWKKQQKIKSNEQGQQPGLADKKSSAQEYNEHMASDEPRKGSSSPLTPTKSHSRPTSPAATEKTSISSAAAQRKNVVPKTGKPRTVPPPSQHLASWQTNHIAPKRARKSLVPGLRVKVRFSLRKEGGKKKKKWFGGSIAAVSKEGTKVKIMYDDGTHEITKFPDKDIVIDDTENGEHKAPLAVIELFLPPEQEEVEAGEKEERAEMATVESTKGPNTNNNEFGDKSKLTDTHTFIQSDGIVKQDKTESQATNTDAKEIAEIPIMYSDQHPDDLASRKFDAETDAPDKLASEPVLHSIQRSANSQHTPNDSSLSKDMYMDEPVQSTSTDSPAEQPLKRKRGRPPKIRPSSDTDTVRSNHYSEAASSDFTKPAPSDMGLQARGPLSIKIPLGKLEHHLPGKTPKAGDSSEFLEKYDRSGQSPKGIKRKQSNSSFACSSNTSLNQLGDEISESNNFQSSPFLKKKIRKVLEGSQPDIAARTADDSLVLSKPAPLDETLVPIASNSAPQTDYSVEENTREAGDSRNTPVPSSLREESETTPTPPHGKHVSTEGAPLVRSGRRAAHQANERIVAKVESSEHLLKLKKKNNQGDEADDLSVKQPEWVQCDRCSKWRVIPSNFIDSLPTQWYCEDNIHDPKRASCDAPEQTLKEVNKERRREKKKKQRMLEAAAAAEGEKRERVRSPYPVENTDELMQVNRSSPDLGPSLENEEDHTKSDRKEGPFGGRKGRTAYASSDTLDAATDSVPEIRRGRGRPRRTTAQSDKESGNLSSKGNNDDVDNVEWVQCEKCDKWRKLPPHISASELPDVWYCDMNTWSTSLTCDDPEDKADGLLDVGFLGTSGSSGKLSYRNLIFGNTGRKANRPISERTRAAESLFGTIEEGEDVAPVVKYSNCCAFISRSKAVAGSKENTGPSLFDVIQNCSFVSELRSIQEANSLTGRFNETDTSDSLIFGQTYDTLPLEVKSHVKKLVLEALSSLASSGEEITEKVNSRSCEPLSDADARALSYCTINVVVTTLCALAKEGVLEVVHPGGAMWTTSDWNPRYRIVRPPCAPKRENCKSEFQRKETRFMKISKPWKHMAMQ